MYNCLPEFEGPGKNGFMWPKKELRIRQKNKENKSKMIATAAIPIVPLEVFKGLFEA